jgi:hypothetical protein
MGHNPNISYPGKILIHSKFETPLRITVVGRSKIVFSSYGIVCQSGE